MKLLKQRFFKNISKPPSSQVNEGCQSKFCPLQKNSSERPWNEYIFVKLVTITRIKLIASFFLHFVDIFIFCS